MEEEEAKHAKKNWNPFLSLTHALVTLPLFNFPSAIYFHIK
jgi:hypothetical protein